MLKNLCVSIFKPFYFRFKELSHTSKKTPLALALSVVTMLSVSFIFASNISAFETESKIRNSNNQTYFVNSSDVDTLVEADFDSHGVDAFGLYIDDKFVTAFENKDQIDFLLNGSLILNNSTLNSDNSCFEENVYYVSGKYNEKDLSDYATVKNLLKSSQNDVVLYKVKSSDSLSSVSELFCVSEDEILNLNGLENPDEIPLQDTLLIKLSKPLLNIKASARCEYSKEIPYGITYENDEEMMSGTQECVSNGVNGKETYTDTVVYLNGVEVSRQNISYNKVKEPVNEVVRVGTKEETDTFIWPVPTVSCITSTFGPRWGTQHRGIDISSGSCYGETIIASKSGVVTCASDLNDGYGIHVIIDHGDGTQTLYGHASAALVSVGEAVTQGQPIALIGSTGDSTGPHLHFEIIENSTKVDPLGYLG